MIISNKWRRLAFAFLVAMFCVSNQQHSVVAGRKDKARRLLSTATVMPSFVPSNAPSTSSSESPSSTPSSTVTTAPSYLPSTSITIPTYYHTEVPSSLPSSLPSSQPTFSPTGAPTPEFNVAVFDPSLGVPLCSTPADVCDSGVLLKSRGSLTPPEQNAPNTLDGCIDGNTGVYSSDESLERLRVISVGGGTLRKGTTVEVQATVYAFRTAAKTQQISTILVMPRTLHGSSLAPSYQVLVGFKLCQCNTSFLVTTIFKQ